METYVFVALIRAGHGPVFWFSGIWQRIFRYVDAALLVYIKIKATGSSETSVTFYETIMCRRLENHDFKFHFYQNPKCYFILKLPLCGKCLF
jgi:hypothetical protein